MKRVFKSACIAAVLCLSLSSCHTYWQVAHVATVEDNISLKQNNYVASYDRVDVKYDFWGSYGHVDCIVTNKTDKDMVIDMRNSYFIKNGSAYVYTAAKKGVNNIMSGENVVVPASCWVRLFSFKVTDFMYRDCDLFLYDFDASERSEVSFHKENSPLVFENRLSIRFEGEDSVYKVNNEFYIDRISNMTNDQFKKNDWEYKFCMGPEGINGADLKAEIANFEKEKELKLNDLKEQRLKYYNEGDYETVKFLNKKIKKCENTTYQEHVSSQNNGDHKNMKKYVKLLEKGDDKFFVRYHSLSYGFKAVH